MVKVTGSGLFPMASIGIKNVKPLGSAIGVLVINIFITFQTCYSDLKQSSTFLCPALKHMKPQQNEWC